MAMQSTMTSSGVDCDAHQTPLRSAIKGCPQYCQQKDEVMRILVHKILELSRQAAKLPPSTALSTATAGPPQGGLVRVQSPDYANARNPRKVTEYSPVNSLHIK